jgi:quinol monooxygenase YgiN
MHNIWCMEPYPMFARIVEFSPTSDAAAQFVQIIQEKVLPIIKAQAGCLRASVEVRHNLGHVVLGVSVWDSKVDAERYRLDCYPEIEEMLRPFLKCTPRFRTFEGPDIGQMIVQWDAMLRKISPGARPAAY